MLIWIIAAIIILIIGLALYWQLILAEGAYLGAPLVALLYDWTAERYNIIKEFEPEAEDFWVGEPLARRLRRQPEAIVLDVATGTARVPLVLLRQPGYQGRVIGLDRASRMLAVARRHPAGHDNRVILIQADAMALPFASNSMPMVTCMEALEFLPNPTAGLAELIRVLQPATPAQPQRGWLLTTQRIGWEAQLMPGKTWSNDQLLEIFSRFPVQQVKIQIWQDIYNLVWAQKVDC
ncbi:MAG: class I SAM-dependent methyltransferase [Chloroflexi bacterium]|nr:class I SAM-dependent methyltransferase [Chloroflexota bacterium]